MIREDLRLLRPQPVVMLYLPPRHQILFRGLGSEHTGLSLLTAWDKLTSGENTPKLSDECLHFRRCVLRPLALMRRRVRYDDLQIRLSVCLFRGRSTLYLQRPHYGSPCFE